MSSQREPVRLSFYFDPLCPWAWMTSLWIREVRNQIPLEVEWKFFSLAGINDRDQEWHGPLRIAALARREGGNEAVDRAYIALGRLFHENKAKFEEIDRLPELAEPLLAEVGLDPSLASRALEDSQTMDDVLAEHGEAVEKFRAFGVPWIVVEGDEAGFFGPVIGELPRGQEAVELWDHFNWLARQPSLYEVKRGGRKQMQDLSDLSAGFLTKEPAGTATS